MSKLSTTLITILIAPFLSGCLVPYTSERSSETTGRVIDAVSHAPVVGAEVRWAKQSKPCVKTDALGTFELPHTVDWYFVSWGHWEWPGGHNLYDLLVTHPDYENALVTVGQYCTNEITGRGQRAKLNAMSLTHKHE